MYNILIAQQLRNASKALLSLKRVPPEVIEVARALLDHADEVDWMQASFEQEKLDAETTRGPVDDPEEQNLIDESLGSEMLTEHLPTA